MKAGVKWYIPDKKASDCITDILKQKDEGYTHMSERMELFRQKKICCLSPMRDLTIY